MNVYEILTGLLDTLGRDLLATLLFEAVDLDDLDWQLARLSHRVAPVYLPLSLDADLVRGVGSANLRRAGGACAGAGGVEPGR
jgi:hypothetical protein